MHVGSPTLSAIMSTRGRRTRRRGILRRFRPRLSSSAIGCHLRTRQLPRIPTAVSSPSASSPEDSNSGHSEQVSSERPIILDRIRNICGVMYHQDAREHTREAYVQRQHIREADVCAYIEWNARGTIWNAQMECMHEGQGYTWMREAERTIKTEVGV